MDALEAIMTRVSVRDYKEEPVPEAIPREVLKAAIRAPSGENLQPWRFIIIQDNALKQEIGELTVQAAQKYFTARFTELEERFAGIRDEERRRKVVESLTTGSRMRFVGTAPLLIVACGDRETSPDDYVQGVSAAIENMLLAAHSLGLGACWTELALRIPKTRKTLYSLLNIPAGIEIIALVTMGFPSRLPKPRPRKNLSEVTFYDRYGQTK